MTQILHPRLVRLIGLLLLAPLLAACDGGATGNGNGDGPAVETITLERQPCFGACPVYTVTIHGDGRVEYNGADFVEVTGAQTAAVAPSAVQALADRLTEAGYFDWDDSYMNQDVTDLPYVISSVTLSDGTTKRIEHYHGDGSAPDELTDLENLIDETANTAQWVGPPAQLEPEE